MLEWAGRHAPLARQLDHIEAMTAPPGAPVELRVTTLALRSDHGPHPPPVRAARRPGSELGRLIRQHPAGPALLAEPGVGPVVAAQMLISWSHPGRVRSDAAFATLAGVAPLEVSSGQRTRHRLSRDGDRALNRALHTVAITRMRCHPETRAYETRRTAQGKTHRDTRRCLKAQHRPPPLPRHGIRRPAQHRRTPQLTNRNGSMSVNVVIESFWGRMQTGLLNRRKWRTRMELANAIFGYLEIFHNRRRRHSALGMLTPIEHELLADRAEPVA
jgi:hypothetical protein